MDQIGAMDGQATGIGPGNAEENAAGHGRGEGAPATPPKGRRAKKAANAERRERHRAAEARIEAERARRRDENRAAREQDAAARAARQRAADEAREQQRREATARAQAPREEPRRRADAAPQADPAREAERERRRRAAAEKRAARAERDRRRADRQAERRRAKEAARRDERDAIRARALGTDPYAILGIAPDAPDEEVARAYRRLARALHPDLNREGTPQERAAREAQMKRVNIAYGLLGDPQRRAAHDRVRRR